MDTQNAIVESWSIDVQEIVSNYHVPTDGLAKGKLGQAVFLLGYYQYSGNDLAYQRGIQLLNEVIQRLGKEEYSLRYTASIANGLSGLGLVLLLLKQSNLISEDQSFEIFQKKLAHLVFNSCMDDVREGDLDFLHASIGGLHYLLAHYKEHREVGMTHQEIERLIRAILDKCEPVGETLAIRNQRIKQANGYAAVNLGLAHGMVGTVLVLLEAYDLGLCKSLLVTYIPKLIGFILATENPVKEDLTQYLFLRTVYDDPSVANPYAIDSYLWSGWCYSDLSVAYMLLRAGVVLQADTYTQKGKLVIEHVLKQSLHGYLPVDSSMFCHGAAGIALLFRQVYALTGEIEYMEASNHWKDRTKNLLEMEIDKGQSTDGYKLLQGWGGAAMALMSLSRPDILKWECVFLL